MTLGNVASSGAVPTPTTDPAVRMVGITKRFGPVLANDRVDLDLRDSEIHVLLGENGAGKTTLANILFGHLRPDGGELVIRGTPVAFDNPNDALHRGIGMVHQHFSLVDGLTVAENVVLGSRPARTLRLRRSSIEQEVAATAARVGIPIDPGRRVADLPADLQQRVEILKVLHRGVDILILDEPTALLGPVQIANLLMRLRDLRAGGSCILLVTHKLAEVMQVADRVTVLRAGRRELQLSRGEFDERALARAMTGHQIPGLPARRGGDEVERPVVLEARDLAVQGSDGTDGLSGLSFALRAGEILGVVGVEGNGQRELVDALTGLTPASGGSIVLDGTDVTGSDPRAMRGAGLGVVPQDRHRWGLVLDMTLEENLALPEIAAGSLTRFGLLRRGDMRSRAAALLEEFDVRPPLPEQQARALSGGNQQKVVLARELSRNPKVLLADNPTWGLDVGALDFVHRRLLQARDEGCAIVLLSLDLEELFTLADRIVVLFRGRATLHASTHEVSIEEVGVAMAGGGG